MTKLKLDQLNLKFYASLLWIISFLLLGSPTHMYGANTINTVFEQNSTITGTVVSADDNMGVPGINVILKGTSTGAVTDFDGNYSIKVTSPNDVLVFSGLGFVSQEITVGSSSIINVSMKSDMMALDEVIIVGFGTQKKETLTGSVSQVKGEEVFRGKGTSSAALALQGEVPGVVVTRTSSRPGNDGANIQIRGDISVNNISPLILLDGLEIPEWQLSTINANDIQTYSVLKDGAAAIYGTKAAGGVILVTTKQGKQGKMKVSYKGEVQANYAGDMPVADMKEWAELWLMTADNDTFSYVDNNGATQQSTGTFKLGLDRDDFQSIVDGTIPMAPDSFYMIGKDMRLADVDQFDAVYGTTMSTRHDLSISGGDEKATYRTSFGFADDRSPVEFVYDGAKRYNLRTNLTYKVSDLVRTEFNISYDNRIVDEPTLGVGQSIADMNIFPLYNEEGQYYDEFGGNNILAQLDEGGRTVNDEKIFRFGGKVILDLDKYVKGLSFTYSGNMSSRNGRKTTRQTSVTNYTWDGDIGTSKKTLANSYVNVAETEVAFQNHVLQVNYQKSIKKHNFAILAGYTAEQSETAKYTLKRSNMLSDELDAINTGDIETQSTSGSAYTTGLVSYIGKINYDYDGIYLLEALGRRDGSSRLHPDYRWKNFFGGSAGVRLSEIPIIKDINVFDNLKIRGSYGETGSVTGIGSYDYISSIGTGSTYFGTSPSIATTAYVSALTSTDRTWERVGTTNFALDFSVLDGRLSGVSEIYSRKNNDMLISITYPDVLGATAPKTNSGDFKSDGFELSLNWRDQIGELKYKVGVMYWDSKSEITNMEGASDYTYGVNKTVEGRPLNAIYTYKTDGYLQNDQEVLDYYNQLGFVDPANQATMKTGTLIPAYTTANRLVPGSVRRLDTSGDGTISTDDLEYYGDANAHNNYSFSLGLEYKGWDFTAFFQGVGKQNVVRTQTLAYPWRRWWRNQNSYFLDSSWTPENTNAENPVISHNGNRNKWNYLHTNDVNVIKANYLRAKVITLGYSLSPEVLTKLNMDRVRFSVTGNDLFVISNVKDGMDPEVQSEVLTGDITPYTSTLLFGVELTF